MDKQISDHVYLFECGGIYKIGITNSIKNRLTTMRGHCPIPVVCICSVKHSDARRYEYYLHSRFKDVRANGEWFRLTSEHVQFVKEQMKNPPSPDQIIASLRKRVPSKHLQPVPENLTKEEILARIYLDEYVYNWLNLSQVSDELGCDLEYVQSLIANGLLETKESRSFVFIHKDALAEYMTRERKQRSDKGIPRAGRPRKTPPSDASASDQTENSEQGKD